MRINDWMKLMMAAVGIAVLSSAASAAVVTNYTVENTIHSDWWPCSWTSPAGDAWVFYQADRDSNGRNIVGRKITGTVAGPEVTIVDGVNDQGENEPIVRGTAGYLVSHVYDDSSLKVVDLNNSNAVVYSRSGDVSEARIYDKVVVWGDGSNLYYRDLGSSSPSDVWFATTWGAGWMGHPDIEGDYIVFQYNPGTHNNILLYQISTGSTIQLTDDSEGSSSEAPHIGGGYVAWQNYDSTSSGNTLHLYNIATATRVAEIPGGYFEDTVPGPVISGNYMVFTMRDYAAGSGPDVMCYDIAAGATFPIVTISREDNSATISNGRVAYGAYNGTNNVGGAVISDQPVAGEVAGVVTLGDFSGDTALAPILIELTQGGTTLFKQTVTAGSYSFNPVDPGTYALSFTTCGWQRKAVGSIGVTAGSTSQVDAVLANGDADGSGSVDLNDFSIVDKNYGLASE